MSKLNIVSKREAPVEPYTGELTCTIIESIPFVLGSLKLRSEKYWWATDDDWRNGRRLLNNQGANMLLGCCDEITKRQDQMYRLFDASINGTAYSYEQDEDTGEITFSPEIPIVPAVSDPIQPSLRWMANDQRVVLRNFMLGETSTALPDGRIPRQQLEDILNALLADAGDSDEIIAKLQQLVTILGAVGL